jgi:hypothetical protein
MNVRSLVVAITCAVVFATASPAQTLTDAQIAEAIKSGETKKYNHLISDCVATAGFGAGMAAAMAGGVNQTGAFNVVLSGNAGRIAFMAARAKRLYKPFAMENVTEDLRAPAVVISVEPQDPYHGAKSIDVAAPIEHVVLKSKANPTVSIQPKNVETEPVEWSNLLGGKVAGNRAVAFFEHNAVQELPPGEFDIVVITTAGERRCKVGVKDRTRLFPAATR